MKVATAIEANDLTVSYDKKPALWDVDFRMPGEELTAIIGPNGSGKTTLLKSIMGLMEPDSGSIRIFGKPLNKVRSQVAYVPQRGSVDWDFPATVQDIVRMGRYRPGGLFSRLSKQDKKIAEQAIEQVGLQPQRDQQIGKLSGGQQQRVFLARALAQKASLYLMDEPFAGVDASTENTIIEILQQMKKEGATVVIVHHDLHTAMDHFDRILLLNTRMIGIGPPTEILSSENLKATYGGGSTILSKVGHILQEKEFPVREEKEKG